MSNAQAKPPSGGLEGMAVLVTGGGTGIGTGCALQLAADGAAVTICGRTESRLVDAAKRIAAAGHGGAMVGQRHLRRAVAAVAWILASVTAREAALKRARVTE